MEILWIYLIALFIITLILFLCKMKPVFMYTILLICAYSASIFIIDSFCTERIIIAGLLLICSALFYFIFKTVSNELNYANKPNVYTFIEGIGFKNPDKNAPFFIEVLNDRLNIRYSNHIFHVISMKNIISAKYIYENELTENDKSVIGRALVGGLVFGVAGAVVGGMSAMGTKTKTKCYLKIETKNQDYYFSPLEGRPNNIPGLIDSLP